MLEKCSLCSLSTDLLLLIMEYLEAKDLCRCSQVSWSWYCINKYLDNTTWKRLFLRDFGGILNFRSAIMYFHKSSEVNNDLINEDFLMNTFTCQNDEKTWKELYRNHFIWKNLWKLRSEEILAKSCGCVFRPLVDKSDIHVGPVGFHYTSIRDAILNIHPYCTVIVHPGNYDEQSKITVPLPFQIIGSGMNSPITIYFDCDTPAVRMCNLFIKPPWFSEILLRVRGGFVQLESCDLMNGEIHVTSPGVLAMRYCNLNNAKISFFKSFCSTVEHCDFKSNTDFNEFIHIEGAPRYERLTACTFLLNQIKKSLPFYLESHNIHRSNANKNENSFPSLRKTKSYDNLFRKTSMSSMKSPTIQRNHINFFHSDFSKIQKIHTQVNLALLKDNRIMHLLPNFDDENKKNYGTEKIFNNSSFDDLQLNCNRNSAKEVVPKSIDRRSYSKFIRKCCCKDEVKQIMNNINGPLLMNCNFSHSKFVVNCMLEANVIIINCEMFDCGDIIRLSRFSKAFIYHNRMYHSSGNAICLKHGSEAFIIGNEIYGMIDGAIEIRKNTSPHILANKIHSNGKCGISFVSNTGHVEFNDICFNKIGINILHSANPIIRSNTIRSNISCGIIINERSISVLDDNLIFKNQESNIWIRKYSAPVITCNFIYQAQADGIHLEDGSKGTIANNIIMGNFKNGILLLNADLPYIYGNQICQNKQHGIHIARAVMDNEDIISDEQDNEFESNSIVSYCDTTYSSEYEEYNYSRNANDSHDFDNDLNRINADEKWVRRKHGLIHIEFNSIYFNSGCGISNDTNVAIEILDNAIHANSENGISLIVPGVFGLTYGSPKLSFLDSQNETMKKFNLQNQLNTVNTFILEDSIDEPKINVVNTKATPYFRDNHSQWKMRHRTLGQILKNSITDNGANGITINTTHFSAARFVIAGNGIYDNQGNGLSIQTECEIINNDILGNNKAALQAKSRAWIYLTMNRLLSAKTNTIDIYQPSTTLICKTNIIYTTSLENNVINVTLENGITKANKDRFLIKCFTAFKSANAIEFFPDNTSDASYIHHIRSSFSNGNPQINSITGLRNYPLRPIIVKDTHYVRVSIALSDAMNSFNRSPRSEICLIL